MERAGFDRRTPELERVADWAARGLTAYDAVYVALAEEEGIELITDDDLIVHIAGAVRLAAAP